MQILQVSMNQFKTSSCIADRPPIFKINLWSINFSDSHCMQLLGLPPKTKDVDVSLVQRNWDRFKKLTHNGRDQWRNYTFLMDTTSVCNLVLFIKVTL